MISYSVTVVLRLYESAPKTNIGEEEQRAT